MTLRGILQVGSIIGSLAGLYFVVDWIGDRREAKVHARYAAAAKATNLDLQRYNSDDEKVAAVAEALRQKALQDAKEVGPACLLTEEQAKAFGQVH